MFGGDKSDKIKKMVAKGQWDKLNKKFLNGSTEERLELAKACGESPDDESYNILVQLLKDSDEKVLLESIGALGKIATSRAETQLQWVLDNIPAEKKDIHAAVRDAMSKIRSRR